MGNIHSKQGSEEIALHNNDLIISVCIWIKCKAKRLEILQDSKQNGILN